MKPACFVEWDVRKAMSNNGIMCEDSGNENGAPWIAERSITE